MRRCLLCIVAVLATLYDVRSVYAQGVSAVDSAPFDPPDKEYSTGYDPNVEPELRDRAPITEQFRAFLPVAADLSGNMLPPGDQGKAGTCAGFATVYGALSYYVSAIEGRDLHDIRNMPSPGYVMSFIKGYCCTNMYAVAEILKKGAVSIADYPYTENGKPAPSPELIARAHDFQVRGTRRVNFNRLDDIKGQLVRGNPVIIILWTDAAFQKYRGDTIFADRSPKKNEGLHSIVVVGYDDRRQAFRVMNSWGQGWGDHGYMWFSYDVVKLRLIDAGVLEVRAPKKPRVVPRPPPAPPPPSPPPILVEPKPPAPTPQPSPADRFSFLKNLSCSDVNVGMQNNRDVLSGFVASDNDLNLIKREVAKMPNSSIGNIFVAPWPQCEALQTLQKSLAEIDQPKIVVASNGDLRDGDTLPITIRSPSQISYLYVSYIQADGSVVNLVQPTGLTPPPTLPNTVLTFGDGQEGRAKFTISPPFGREMIIAVASRSPLFEQDLPATQTEREYLTTLRRALIFKPAPDLPDREVTAAIKTLQTRAR